MHFSYERGVKDVLDIPMEKFELGWNVNNEEADDVNERRGVKANHG